MTVRHVFFFFKNIHVCFLSKSETAGTEKALYGSEIILALLDYFYKRRNSVISNFNSLRTQGSSPPPSPLLISSWGHPSHNGNPRNDRQKMRSNDLAATFSNIFNKNRTYRWFLYWLLCLFSTPCHSWLISQKNKISPSRLGWDFLQYVGWYAKLPVRNTVSNLRWLSLIEY